MKGEDRRVLRTRQKLGDAIVALTLERGYESVTIRELTERAGIGYATFFRHYPDKDSLLHALLEGVLSGLLQRLEPLSTATDPTRTGLLVFRHVRANADLYRVLIDSQRSVDLFGRALEVGTHQLLISLRPKPSSVVPATLAAHHVVRSFMALIEWWLANGMKPSAEVMAEAYTSLIFEPSLRVAFDPVDDPTQPPARMLTEDRA